MDVVGAFVGVNGFQIYEMSDHVVLVANTVSPERIPRPPRDVQRFAGGIPLYQRYHFRQGQSLFLQPAHLQTRQQADGYLGDHVGVFFLDQLRGGQRFAELFAIQAVRPGNGQARFGRPESAPRNSVPGVVQTAERS